MRFLSSYLGMYMSQTILHSMIALFIIERALEIWEIKTPLERFRYRVSVIILPIFMFPLFQLINPERGSFYFREDTAIFDSLRWFEIKLWGGIPLGIGFFFFIVLLTSIAMLLQEIIPIIKDALPKKKTPQMLPADKELQSIIKGLQAQKTTGGAAQNAQGAAPPDIWITSDENPVIFTLGAKNPSIVLSKPLLEMLDAGQLRSALAHELAHIIRRSNIITFVVFILRILMFYNPVSLLIFRRIVQDDEEVCDDMTVSMTGNSHALASTLRAFYSKTPGGPCRMGTVKETIENSSHNLLLEERILRLEGTASPGDRAEHPGRWGRYVLTIFTVIGINYFIT